MKKLTDSFGHAIDGVIYCIKTQRNMRIHIAAAATVTAACLYIRPSRVEMMILFLVVAFVIVCEMFNTAIEKAIDISIKEFHPLAKISKDVAAGAVLVSALCSIAVGYLLFVNEINPLIEPIAEKGINKIIESPYHLAVISIAFVILIVIIIKYKLNCKNLLRGGMPSGHSAVAFSLVTTIWYITGNIFIRVLVFLLGVLVIQSRIEGKIHSALEAILGASLGIAITIALFNILM